MPVLFVVSLGAFALCALDHMHLFSCTHNHVAFVVSRAVIERHSHLFDCSIFDHSPTRRAKMFSLIRKISGSQHTRDDMTEQAKDDGDDDKHETKQQEEVDGTSYDPDADPRDPGSYYTFPHFAEE